MKSLHEISYFVSEKINSSEIELQDYVTTDNLLQNKEGVTLAISLPVNNTNLTKYEKGDTLVSNIRPYLRKIWFANKSGGCSNDVLVFRAKEKNDPAFLYYSLLQNNFFDFVMAGAKGTKMPRGDKSQMMNFSVSHFDLPTQQKIAQVLSTLDRKIALNQQINAELEKMAKTLYDYWFVQFDFPDENGNPYKSSGGEMVYNPELKRDVPKGWESGTLDDLGQIVGGSTPSTAEDANFSENATAWITPNDLSNNQGNKFISHGAIDVSEQGIKSASLKIYPKGTVLLSSRAPVGYMAIAQNELTTNQGFKSFIPNKSYSEIFIYYVVKNLIPVIEQNSSGSTFKEISATALKNISCLLPEKEVVRQFVLKTTALFEKQSAIEKENKKLTQLRDFLLPMLMNGQVEVDSLDFASN